MEGAKVFVQNNTVTIVDEEKCSTKAVISGWIYEETLEHFKIRKRGRVGGKGKIQKKYHYKEKLAKKLDKWLRNGSLAKFIREGIYQGHLVEYQIAGTQKSSATFIQGSLCNMTTCRNIGMLFQALLRKKNIWRYIVRSEPVYKEQIPLKFLANNNVNWAADAEIDGSQVPIGMIKIVCTEDFDHALTAFGFWIPSFGPQKRLVSLSPYDVEPSVFWDTNKFNAVHTNMMFELTGECYFTQEMEDRMGKPNVVLGVEAPKNNILFFDPIKYKGNGSDDEAGELGGSGSDDEVVAGTF